MTDNEIIKALKCCSAALMYDEKQRLYGLALNLINRLQAENKKNENIIRLADKTIATQKAEIDGLQQLVNLSIDTQNEMNDTIIEQKEEIERLKEKRIEDDKLLNDRVQEAINSVSKANQKYVDALEKAFNDRTAELKTAKDEAVKEYEKILEEKATYMYDPALGYCKCVLLEDVIGG